MASTEHSEVLGIKGFKASKDYEQVRPVFPREGVELLMNKLGLIGEKRDTTTQLTVLELGAGTGKFTRVMAEVLRDANVRIIASDPVKEMCEQFKEVQPDIEIRQFLAEHIDLPSQSVDAVVSANSFHWFDFHRSLDQIHGVLKPNGTFVTCWLFPSPETDWVKPIAEYVAPMFEENSITFVMWYCNKIIDQISSTDKFSKLSEVMPPKFDQHFKLTPQQAYDLFASFSVIAAASDQKKAHFKEFFERTVSNHCSITGEKELAITHVFPMALFEKIN